MLWNKREQQKAREKKTIGHPACLGVSPFLLVPFDTLIILFQAKLLTGALHNPS